jgi:hypothetical protein
VGLVVRVVFALLEAMVLTSEMVAVHKLCAQQPPLLGLIRERPAGLVADVDNLRPVPPEAAGNTFAALSCLHLAFGRIRAIDLLQVAMRVQARRLAGLARLANHPWILIT